MKRKFYKTTLLSLLPLSLGLPLAHGDCDTKENVPQKTFALPDVGYWMQVAGDRYVTFTRKGGTHGQMFDMMTAKEVTTMSREVDPFPLPEGDLIIQPQYDAGGNELAFYRTDDLRDKGARAVPLFVDRNHRGNYQSLGVLEKNGDTRTVRVFMAAGGGTVQDYTVVSKGSTYQIHPVHPRPIEVCKNLNRRGLNFQTPVLSRDGKKFATIDLRTDSMKVYDLEIPSGNCAEGVNLGIRTDKVSFSFDGKSISYKTQKKMKAGWRPQLLVRNLENGSVITINKPEEEVLYHSWSPGGDFLYTVQNGRSVTLKIIHASTLADLSRCFDEETPPEVQPDLQQEVDPNKFHFPI